MPTVKIRMVSIFAAALLQGAFCSAALAQKVSDVKIPGNDGREYSAKLYVPEKGVPAPGVMVLHSFYGFSNGEAENFDHAYARALAREGFVSLVPNYAHPSLKARPHHLSIPADLKEIAAWLAGRPETSGKSIGVVGFSIGSKFAMQIAAGTTLPLKAVVGYYGYYDLSKQENVVKNFKGKSLPVSPVDAVDRINVPVLLLHGTLDDETRIEQATNFKDALEKANRTVQLATYQGAYHRFDRGPNAKMKGDKSPDGHVYRLDSKARDDAWQRTLAFLRANLN